MRFGHRPAPDPWSTRERVYRNVQRSTARNGRISLASGVLAIATLLLVASYSAYQVSEEQRTRRLIEQGVASVTDVDTYLRETLPALRAAAQSSQDDLFTLPGYPVDIRLEAGELRSASDAEIRALVLRRSASYVYDEGLDAFAVEGGQSLGIITAENAADVFLSLLRGSMHGRSAALSVFLAALCAVCAAVIAASDPRPGILRAIGGAMLGGALTGLALSVVAIFAVDSASGGDAFSREIARTASSVFEVPRRNFAIAAAFSAVLFGAGWALTILERRSAPANREPAWAESATGLVDEGPAETFIGGA